MQTKPVYTRESKHKAGLQKIGTVTCQNLNLNAVLRWEEENKITTNEKKT